MPANDPNVIRSFHMYQPMLFTHQGAPWMGPAFQTHGVVFPGPPPAPITPVPAPAAQDPSGPSTIAEQLDMAASWQAARHLPVYMGEFGADDVADLDSRVRWTRMTRVEAERRGGLLGRRRLVPRARPRDARVDRVAQGRAPRLS